MIFFFVFFIRCVSTCVHKTTDMSGVYIDNHSVIVVLSIYDWMCNFSIVHSVYDFVVIIQYFFILLLYDVVVFLLAVFSTSQLHIVSIAL